MKALLAICTLAFAIHAAHASSEELGLLANYYADCPARYGPHAAELRSVIRHALRGDPASMRLVLTHGGIFSTGDNEAYSEVPQALLRTLGDDRYSAFIVSQPHHIQHLALNVFPEQIADFPRRFPKTAKLYPQRF